MLEKKKKNQVVDNNELILIVLLLMNFILSFKIDGSNRIIFVLTFDAFSVHVGQFFCIRLLEIKY